jgi:glycosyltransferase involved in cell wall biosynthesis
MKLLVLAQTPPPVHGQSIMVQALVDGLSAKGIEVVLVQMRLSKSHSDIGRWRLGKVARVVLAALKARRVARAEKCDALYYVPAPAKRGAFYRDVVAMAICRLKEMKLVLHWHAPGLGEWLVTGASPLERMLALRALGRADLSLVLAPELVQDAEILLPWRTATVPNGIEDPGPKLPRLRKPPFEVIYVGLGSEAKGLFDTLEAASILQKRVPGGFRLTFAGAFADPKVARLFRTRAAATGASVREVGFADAARKRELLSESDLFCMPTHYAGEGQPLALLEAMAYDLPVVSTRWRGIPSTLPAANVWYVSPGRPQEIAEAIQAAANSPSPSGAMREHFLRHFTGTSHLSHLASAIGSLASN